MTDFHSIAVKVDVYPDEFKPIMKAINHAIKDEVSFTSKEIESLRIFKDDFASLALEFME